MENLRNYQRTDTRRRTTVVVSSRVAHVAVDAKFLSVNGERFWVKGVTYGTFAPDENGDPFPPLWQVKDDFARMRDAGINTVRLYAPPPDAVADAAQRAGLYLIPDICWGPRTSELDYPGIPKLIFESTRRHAKRLAGHPAILMNSAGNEIPPLIVRWYGRKRVERFLREITETIKEAAPDTPVTYVNHPPTEYLQLPFIDVVSFNIYLEREADFRSYLARLQSLAGNRPLLLAELGLDANSRGDDAQARSLEWQLRAVME
jgi:beta-galactosidase/beta-glucuronidase